MSQLCGSGGIACVAKQLEGGNMHPSDLLLQTNHVCVPNTDAVFEIQLWELCTAADECLRTICYIMCFALVSDRRQLLNAS